MIVTVQSLLVYSPKLCLISKLTCHQYYLVIHLPLILPHDLPDSSSCISNCGVCDTWSLKGWRKKENQWQFVPKVRALIAVLDGLQLLLLLNLPYFSDCPSSICSL